MNENNQTSSSVLMSVFPDCGEVLDAGSTGVQGEFRFLDRRHFDLVPLEEDSKFSELVADASRIELHDDEVFFSSGARWSWGWGEWLGSWWGLRGFARAASPLFVPAVLRCVSKTRTLRMYPAGATIAQVAYSSTRDVGVTHRAGVLDRRPWVGVDIACE